MHLRSLPLFLLSSVLALAASTKDTITREIPWSGAESLTIDVPAHVRFVQAPGPGKIVVTGPRRSVERFDATNGVLRDHSLRTGAPLEIAITAPKVTRFSAKGDDTLTIENFDQAELHLTLTGRADVKVSGRSTSASLHLQGFGWADLSQLAVENANVSLTGSRKAVIGATTSATLSGNGDVVLLEKPATLTSHLRPAGRVIHAYRTAPATVTARLE